MATEKKQPKSEKPSERTKAEDIPKLIVKLAKEGNTPAKIGIILRDKHNVPRAKLLGTKITKILKDNKIDYEDDLTIVNKKIKTIEDHYSKNKQDKRAKREIVRFIGLRKKLEKYKAKKAK